MVYVLWYHLINISVINAWLLYRQTETENGRKPDKYLFDFRAEIAISLTKMGEIITPKRGRIKIKGVL